MYRFRTMRIRVLCFLLMLTLNCMAQETFYVNQKTGDDNNAGTDSKKAWKTLNANAWKANSVIKVASGTYKIDNLIAVNFPVTVEGTDVTSTIIEGMTNDDFIADKTTNGSFILKDGAVVSFKKISIQNIRYIASGSTPKRNGGIFDIGDNCTLNLEEVVLKNTFLPAALGGAIINKGTLKCKNIVFDNCIAMHGGAVYMTAKSNAYFERCRFTNNSTKDKFESAKYGGAICVNAQQAILTIDKCVFEGNRSENNSATVDPLKPDGGAIALRLLPVSNYKIDITNSSFTNNYAFQVGAAIGTSLNGTPTEKTVLNLDIRNSTFFGNKTSSAIASSGNTINLTGHSTQLHNGRLTLVNNTFFMNNNGNPGMKSIMSNDLRFEYVLVNNVFMDAVKQSPSDRLGVGYSIVLQTPKDATTFNAKFIAMNNAYDRCGGALSNGTGPYAAWTDGANQNLSNLYNDKGKLSNDLINNSLGIPHVAIGNKSSYLINAGINEYLFNGQNIVLPTDINDVGIKAKKKDIGAYEF